MLFRSNRANELNYYRDYNGGLVTVIPTKQTKINCKDNEDSYFFTYNSVGSTSPKLDKINRDVIVIGVSCVDRITQEDNSMTAYTFYNPIYSKEDKSFGITASSEYKYSNTKNEK